MKNYVIALLCFIFITTIKAEPFTIADKIIEIPAPEGYVKVTPQMDFIYRYSHHLMPEGFEMLAYYIPKKDANIELAGGISLMESVFYVAAPKNLNIKTISSNEFHEITKLFQGGIKKEIKLQEANLDLIIDNFSKSISNEFDINIEIKHLDTILFEFHYKEKNAFAFSAYKKFKIRSDNYEEEKIISITATTVNVSGKILNLFCEAPKEQLEWNRSSSIAWSKMILKNNPVPLKNPSIKKTNSWYKIDNWGLELLKFMLGDRSLNYKFSFLVFFLMIAYSFIRSIFNRFK